MLVVVVDVLVVVVVVVVVGASVVDEDEEEDEEDVVTGAVVDEEEEDELLDVVVSGSIVNLKLPLAMYLVCLLFPTCELRGREKRTVALLRLILFTFFVAIDFPLFYLTYC